MLVVVTLSACKDKDNALNQIRTKQNGIWIYNVDFTAKYKKTLDAMFGDKWIITSKEEKKVVPEKKHFDSTPYQYTEWTIQYTDSNDRFQEFALNNIDLLSKQIEDYIEHYVPKFYEEHFYKEYLKGIPLAAASFVFGFLNDIHVDPQIKENKERAKMTEKYRRNLEHPESTINFSKFSPANAFEMCPMYLSIHVSIDDDGYSASDKKKLEEYTKKQVDLMITAMNGFANNKINVEISVANQNNNALYDGKNYWGWYYIRGIAKDVRNPMYFERDVYDGFKGVFW
ncbi:hypothetical protein OB236_13170 [Paenibacillus sp. WQ 127069]|uniref:Lipoprotein n=1 Tax=Paenibacillus baimaensis TaxID=2982185 RepID=A0ABT2UEK8_9BACL|nr:hypothetical protein [Paenibacillus sp. WQ 127069]